MSLQILSPDAISASDYSSDPYPHFLGKGFLRAESIEALRRDFPAIEKPGYLTVDDIELSGSFKQLIEEIESPELTEVLSQRFGLDLHQYPRLTTVRKWSRGNDGRIHSDGTSKIMTMLVYMNDEWQASEDGRLRVLYDEHNFDPYACEVPPTMGTVFGFLRRDNSWHGHKPFTGERKVVQTAWIVDSAQVERKKNRNTLAKFFKNFFS